MEFTKENLIDNLENLGVWSSYGLATIALEYYFPKKYEDGKIKTGDEAELLSEIGCKLWIDAVKKYHSEVGYTDSQLNPDMVNEN